MGHYSPWKPRAEAADRRAPNIGGTVRQFQAGGSHHLALEVPLEDFFMGGIVNKCFGRTTNTLYWAAEVLAAHGGSAGLRDEAALESAVAAPQTSLMGKPWFTEPVELAAAYLFCLCRNHPFVDGHKRTALATCLVFLSENGLLPDEQLDTDARERVAWDVAASQLDREQTTARLKKLLRPRK